jgi:hypothetical protein
VNGDGTAKIPATFGDGPAKEGELQISIEPDGAPPVIAPVRGGHQPADTTMTTTCPTGLQGFKTDVTVNGQLKTVPAGTSVKLTYTPHSPQSNPPFERNVTTDANGNWTDTIDMSDHNNTGNGGQWTLKADYAGDADHKASTATCGWQEDSG